MYPYNPQMGPQYQIPMVNGQVLAPSNYQQIMQQGNQYMQDNQQYK